MEPFGVESVKAVQIVFPGERIGGRGYPPESQVSELLRRRVDDLWKIASPKGWANLWTPKDLAYLPRRNHEAPPRVEN
jgi:hypothetical protein